MSFAGLDASGLALHLGLFGAAMVVLYLLRVRRRTVFVPFSPLWTRVLEQQKATSLFRRLQRWLSLLLQLILVALLVFAISDPRFDGVAAEGCRHVPAPEAVASRTLVLIDTSTSMATVENGRSRLEEAVTLAKKQAKQLLEHSGARVMLATFDATALPVTPWTADGAVIDAALDRMAATPIRDVGTSWPTAMALVAESQQSFEGEAGNFAAVAFSDFAFDVETVASPMVSIRKFRVGSIADNLGIAGFNVRPLPDDPLTYVAWYAVRNTLNRSVAADLFVYANPDGLGVADFNDSRFLVDTVPLVLPAGAVTSGRLETLKFPGDRVMIRVAARTDAKVRDLQVRDDVAFAVVPERRRLRVQLVTPGNSFLEAALSTRENISLTRTAPSNYSGAAGHDVTVLDRVAPVAEASARQLIFDPPGDEAAPMVTEVTATLVDKRHPLARGLVTVDWNIRETRARRLGQADTVVVAGPKKEPLVWASVDPDGSRRVVVGFDITKSLLPLNVAFPVLVVNALNYLADEADGFRKPVATGAQVVVPLPFQPVQLKATGPGGPVEDVRFDGHEARLEMARTGLYVLAGRVADANGSEREVAHVVAANAETPEESLIGGRIESDPATDTSPPETQAAAETSTFLWRDLLLAFLALVVLEQLTWHRRWTA